MPGLDPSPYPSCRSLLGAPFNRYCKAFSNLLPVLKKAVTDTLVRVKFAGRSLAKDRSRCNDHRQIFAFDVIGYL